MTNQEEDKDEWEEQEKNMGFEELKYSSPSKNYNILTEKDVSEKLKEMLQDCQDLFKITKDESLTVLMHYKWNWQKLQEDWFVKANEIKIKAGIMVDPKIPQIASDPNECPVCYESLNASNSDRLGCNHAFCQNCWKNHLKAKIDAGKEIVQAKCPYLKCTMRVPFSLMKKYLSASNFRKYNSFLILSFTEDNKKMKCCPGLNCKFFVENIGSIKSEIKCNCDYLFCYNCSEEAHSPITCEVLKTWNDKNTSESENVTWIKANTKPCPSCKKNIEKNQGCNHMTCSQCKYEFCWICMGDWKAHNGNYNCNQINKDLLQSQESAKNELQKYMFYFERYENHRKAIKKADAENISTGDFIVLMNQIKGVEFIDLEFLSKAINTIKNARRVLSYSYVFGYYLTSIKEVQLFEFLQKDLEFNCDRLHEMIERNKDEFVSNDDITSKAFWRYKSDLAGLCSVVEKV